MKKYYKINFDKLAIMMLPTMLRNYVMIAFAQVVLSPINWLYNQFIKYRDANLYNLSITPQVCCIEKALNDRFDTSKRRIYITKTLTYAQPYLFLDQELKDDFIFIDNENKDSYLHQGSELSAGKSDFIVHIPAELYTQEVDVKSIIDTYKLATKSYTLNYI